MSSSSLQDKDFIEIRPPPPQSKLPDCIQVHVASVKPQQCSALIKDLQQQQFGSNTNKQKQAISHLKRVYKPLQTNNTKNNEKSPPQKKCKTVTEELQVLLGPVDDKQQDWTALEHKYDFTLSTRLVPGRPAQSLEELQEFNKIWPTIYFHEQSKQYQQALLQLSENEINRMREGMQHAIQDAKQANSNSSCVVGAIVMCPSTGKVVATANNERQLQEQGISDNPLATSVLLAIQGVSRKERAAAIGHGMDSEAFQKGQYLCTGYDLFTTLEPGVFEAMALVHSRILRVIFGIPNHVDGGLGAETGRMEMAIHALPGTNHHYRVFSCAPTSDLWKTCRKLHPENNS